MKRSVFTTNIYSQGVFTNAMLLDRQLSGYRRKHRTTRDTLCHNSTPIGLYLKGRLEKQPFLQLFLQRTFEESAFVRIPTGRAIPQSGRKIRDTRQPCIVNLANPAHLPLAIDTSWPPCDTDASVLLSTELPPESEVREFRKHV
jgi:hypothetical protein